jgi:hypothetical protein
MSTTFDMSCLYSTVKNTSGARRSFGFLPPHGRSLAANEEFTLFGDINSRLRHARDRAALESAIDRGDLLILSTPAPLLQDTVTTDVKMLRLVDGTLSAVDPCWETSASAA